MIGILSFVTGLATALAACGLTFVTAGAVAAHRFAIRKPHPIRHRPAITVLKPLCGDEPLLFEALASICNQAYPTFQIVFGVQDANDPALLVVQQIRCRFPTSDIAVVIDERLHGPNRKVSNLMNMMSVVRHEVLVFSDSDVHVQPDYLDRVVAALEVPGTGLVTTVCMGLPTAAGPVARLGATGISHSFLPGALLSRMLGRQDCLGITMAMRRDTLERIGGLASLVRHLVDDNILGQRVRQLGLGVGLATAAPMTAVPENSLRALWQHELRWARTIRSLQPALFAASTLQFPLFWAAVALGLSGGSVLFAGLFVLAWGVRAAAAGSIDRALLQGRPSGAGVPIWMLPFRDLLSVSQVAAAYFGGRVIWRGQVMRSNGDYMDEVKPPASR